MRASQSRECKVFALLSKPDSAQPARTQLDVRVSWRKSGVKGTMRCSDLVRTILVYLIDKMLTSLSFRSCPTVDGIQIFAFAGGRESPTYAHPPCVPDQCEDLGCHM